MQRIHAPFDEPTLAQIDEQVRKARVSRAQWLSSAVGSYLRLLELSKGSDPANLVQELDQARSTIERLWRESQAHKKAEEKASQDVEQLRRKMSALEDQIAKNLEELERARTAMSLMEHDMAHCQDTIRQKDQEIAFLHSHIAQLTQSIGQIALKPGEEESKKKGWWRKFWR